MFRRCILLATAAALYTTAPAADYPPTDHGGANLFLADGDRIWGEHTNINVFTVPATAQVQVRDYDGDSVGAGFGSLAIQARIIIVEGRIDASGSGYSGAGGGGGGAGDWPALGGAGGSGKYTTTWDHVGVLVGWDGADGCVPPGFGDCSVYRGGGNGGDGDGPFGGPFEYDDMDDRIEWARASGGYASLASNGDLSTDDSLHMGSGGCGGRGGLGGVIDSIPNTSGVGGASGGSGGGIIRLVADEDLDLRGSAMVSADGTMGNPRNTSAPIPVTGGTAVNGRAGANAWPSDPDKVIDTTDWLKTGGAGAGGGILLKCTAAGGLRLSPDAHISTLGGGASRLTVNGGTVKLFYSGADPTLSGVTIEAGRLFKGGAAGAVPGWTMYE